MIDSPVLVLNQSYEPLNLRRTRRAITLVFRGKAEDAVPICIDTKAPREIVQAVKWRQPFFASIVLHGSGAVNMASVRLLLQAWPGLK